MSGRQKRRRAVVKRRKLELATLFHQYEVHKRGTQAVGGLLREDGGVVPAGAGAVLGMVGGGGDVHPP